MSLPERAANKVLRQSDWLLPKRRIDDYEPESQELLRRTLALGIGFFVLVFLYGTMGRTFPAHSDDATGILEGDAFLHGNYLLRGWTVSNISYYTTDLPFYIIGVLFRGVHPSLLRDVPAVIYVLTVALAAWLAGRGRRDRRSAWFGMAVAFILIALPSGNLARFVFLWNAHIGTTLLVLGSFAALDCVPGHTFSWRRYVLFTLGLTLAIVGDKLALFIAAVPMIITSAGRLLRREEGGEALKSVALLGSSFSAIIASHCILKLIRVYGGFAEVPLPFQFNTLHVCLNNVVYLTEGVLDLYRTDFFGLPVNLSTVCKLIGLLGLGLVAYSAYHSFPRWLAKGVSGRPRPDFLCEVLSVAVLVSLVAYVVGHGAKDLTTVRYLAPATIFGAILAGRIGVTSAGCFPHFYAGVAALAVVYGALFAKGLLSPPAPNPFIELAGWLEKKHLEYGYGTFWTSSITTVSSENRVKVRSLETNQSHLEPRRWMSDQEWYLGTPARFFVFYTDNESWFARDDNVELATAIHTFGLPNEMSSVGKFTVLIWDKDITSCLAQIPEAQDSQALSPPHLSRSD
jgi:hypothetical protein